MKIIGFLFLFTLASLPCVLCLPSTHELNFDDFSAEFDKWRSTLELQSLPRLPLHPGANMTTPELIEAMGYPVEVHYPITEDGYMLEIHRIPHGKAGPVDGPQKVAFLHHPLLGSSADWIMNTPDEALAYIMADAGYDVWLQNVRGNTYCRNHLTMKPEEHAFWQFTFDEMAYYDAPTSIDYILDATEQDDLYYVGMSMGTTVFFAMLSQRPEYASKIRTMAAMGPAAHMNHTTGLLYSISQLPFDAFFTLLGYDEFLPSNDFMDQFAEDWCSEEAALHNMCYFFMALAAGPDFEELNTELLPVILAHLPAGTSTHTVNHYAQIINSGVFGMYDFGRLGNQNHYGQLTPPVFNLTNVTPPVALFWSDGDWIATPQDVAQLATELPNLALYKRIDRAEFNHFDYIWALHAYELVYKDLLDYLSQY